MVAQQDGHDFALGHLPFAVSHSLISLVYGVIWIGQKRLAIFLFSFDNQFQNV